MKASVFVAGMMTLGVASASPADAAEIKVLSAGAYKSVVVATQPEFEKQTGHKLAIDSDTVGGLAKRIEDGEAFDVVVVSPGAVDDLIKKGKASAGTRQTLARVGIGVMVKDGAAKPDIATVDAFQHWIYSHPAHSRAERTAAWLALMDRFGGDVDWTGYEDVRANLWHRQLHIFIHAFYYIEYGIAQLGALQVWRNSLNDRAAAVRHYREALALGATRPLPDLYKAAGARLIFDSDGMRELIEVVEEELATLDA